MKNIIIQSGTIVQRDDSVLITLSGVVCVDAKLESDGGYTYRLGKHQYYASGGTVSAINC